jgi:hypothetical protein
MSLVGVAIMPRKLNRTTAVAIFAISVAISGNSHASDWVYFDEGSNNSFVYIDKSSINRTRNIVTFWERIDTSRNLTVKYYEFNAQIETNCENRTSKILYTIKKFRNKPAVKQNFYPLRNQLGSPIEPNTMRAAIADAVCAH